MLCRELITEYFSLFSDLEGALLAPWERLCRLAAGQLEARIRPDADVEGNMEALCAAAAALAYCDYLLVGGDSPGDADEIRVGDISLKNAAAATARADAADIRAHFLGTVAHLLEPDCPVLLAAGGDA